MSAAQVQRSTSEGGRPQEYVIFALGEQAFAVSIANVQEIINTRGFTSLPGLAHFMAGVINLRGTVLPVIDLRLKLSMPPRAYDRYTVVLVVEVSGRLMGLIVDGVTDVTVFDGGAVRQSLALAGKVGARFVQGVSERDGELVVRLDLDRLLSEDELAAVDATAQLGS